MFPVIQVAPVFFRYSEEGPVRSAKTSPTESQPRAPNGSEHFNLAVVDVVDVNFLAPPRVDKKSACVLLGWWGLNTKRSPGRLPTQKATDWSSVRSSR